MSESIRRLSFDEVVGRLAALSKPYHKQYLAMYSSWYGGIVTDPALMMVPVDDHMVHRGDGVFEAFKCVDGNIYALDRHLDRLALSAQGLSLTPPLDRNGLASAVIETIRAAGVGDCVIRAFVSRGPGGFSVDPYESPESQLYIVAGEPSSPPEKMYDQGVTLKSSAAPVKKDYFANLKCCNYLPNVLMKKEARDLGVDFTLSIDDRGCLGEGATENVGIITRDGELLTPGFERILRGITISRSMEIARALASSGELARVGEADLRPEDAYRAREVMLFGTSFDVLPVVEFDGHLIGDGRPGPLAKKLLSMLREDMKSNPEMLTRVDL